MGRGSDDALRSAESRTDSEPKEEDVDVLADLSHSPFESIALVHRGRIVDANTRLCDLLGYTRDELIGLDVARFVAPEDRDLVASNVSSGSEEPYEHRALRKDGSLVYVEACGRQVTHRGRRCRLTALRDISERKRTEHDLRESEQMIRALVDNSQDWIWSIDANAVHTYSNPAVENILGYTPEEVKGKGLELLHDDDRAKAIAQVERSTLGKTGWRNLLLRWKRKDGTYRYLESNALPIVNDTGELIGFRGVDRDITERKLMEAERLQLEDQLRQAQKMEAVGQLAGGIAHDFNNLLTVILGNVELAYAGLREEKPSDALWGQVAQIEQGARQAANLTSQLLAFSRRQVAAPQRLNLSSAVAEMRGMLRRLIRENIELNLELADDTPNVTVDPVHFQQVVMNLVVNARDAMRYGGRLTLSTCKAELPSECRPAITTPGDYARLAVQDSGEGMSPEVVDRMFEPFFTTKSRGQGTGLGMAMVYGIVKQCNGDIRVNSRIGEGTTIEIYLPAACEAGEPELDDVLDRDPPRGSETVLVCEDDEAVRRLTVRLLSDAGYEVIQADGSEQALYLLQETTPVAIDLLVTDIIMPGMDGRELASILSQRHPRLKTLFLSGYTADVFQDKDSALQDIELLPKPFTRAQLLERVRRVLEGG